MTNTPEIDRAIVEGRAAERKSRGFAVLSIHRPVEADERAYAQGLILELWRDFPPLVIHSPDQAVEIVRAEFLRRIGIEGDVK